MFFYWGCSTLLYGNQTRSERQQQEPTAGSFNSSEWCLAFRYSVESTPRLSTLYLHLEYYHHHISNKECISDEFRQEEGLEQEDWKAATGMSPNTCYNYEKHTSKEIALAG